MLVIVGDMHTKQLKRVVFDPNVDWNRIEEQQQERKRTRIEETKNMAEIRKRSKSCYLSLSTGGPKNGMIPAASASFECPSLTPNPNAFCVLRGASDV